MARGTAAAKKFKLISVSDKGPSFRPDQDYFSVSLVAIHLPPGGAFKSARFAPVVWSSVRQLSLAGEKTLVGIFPATNTDRPQFARADRVDVMDLQLTPRIIAREELTMDFTLGAVKEKDYLAGVLKIAGDLAASPAAGFVSQIVPVIGAVTGAMRTIDQLHQNIAELVDSKRMTAYGDFRGTLRAPISSGLFAFTQEAEGSFTFNGLTNQLENAKGALKTPYAVIRFQCEPTRPDWMVLPDLTMAWARIRDAAINHGDVKAAVEHFRMTALTSPDLTQADARRVAASAEQKFAPLLMGAESAGMEDPGSMEDGLVFFMQGAESAVLADSGMGRPVTANTAPPIFKRSLDVVLEHEGGFSDNPLDPGGATYKGVTQRVYDEYRKIKNVPKRTVKEMSDDELREIYFEGYWRPSGCLEMPNDPLAMLMFDAAVNHGPKTAIRLLQQAAGIPASNCDGKWGPKTRTGVFAAAANTVGLVDQCLLKRERYYHRIVEINPKLGAFLQGWINRLASLRVHLQPLLARAPGSAESESALFETTGEFQPLRAADPDFSSLQPAAPRHAAIAAQ